MRVAIAIDDWKLPVFEEHLDHEFEIRKGITDDYVILVVETTNLMRLKFKVEHCQRKAAELMN